MKNMIKFELRKLFQLKSFFICGIILIVESILTVILKKVTYNLLAEASKSEISVTQYENGVSSLVTSISAVDISIFLAIIISLFVASDYKCGAIKNIISSGYSRAQVFFSKYIAVLVLTVVYALFALISGFVVNSIAWGVKGDWTSDMLFAILLQILILLALSTVFFAIVIMIRSGGGSIAICIVAPMVLSIGLLVIDTLINSETFKTSDYMLTSCLSAVSKLPVNTDVFLRCGITPVVYIIVAAALGFFVNKKRDV